MRLLGVVGLVSLDRVDGGIPRLGGAPFHAARALRVLGRPALLGTKIAPEDRGRGLHALGFPVYSHPAARTISFRIENDGDRRAMEIDELGDPWTPEDVRGWLDEALQGVLPNRVYDLRDVRLNALAGALALAALAFARWGRRTETKR